MLIGKVLKLNRKIKGLTLSGNEKMTQKAAVFIADALVSHSDPYPIFHLEFNGISLGGAGIRYNNKSYQYLDAFANY